MLHAVQEWHVATYKLVKSVEDAFSFCLHQMNGTSLRSRIEDRIFIEQKIKTKEH